MVKAIKRENLYRYNCPCIQCGLVLLYNNEDIILDEDIDYIICPNCGEKMYV